MKILTHEKVSSNRYKTNEGYLVCIDAILARIGTQIYLNKELFEDGDDEEVEVHREEKEVFDEKTIASFENKPVTIEHPKDFVNTDNHKNLSVGFVRDVRKSIAEGQQVLVGNLIITDSEAIKLIENGKQYLSCGYDCDIVEEGDKFYQRNIRGNHVAICDNPRAGITKIIDSMDPRLFYDSIKAVIDSLKKLNEENFSSSKNQLIVDMLEQIVKQGE